MAVKINTLTEAEIRSIGDAFAAHAYADGEFGMGYLAKDRQAVSDYICVYVRMAIKERVLYSTSDRHEAFIAFQMNGHNMSPSSAADLLGTAYKCADLSHILTAGKGFLHSGKGYGAILSKFKIPYIWIFCMAGRRSVCHSQKKRCVSQCNQIAAMPEPFVNAIRFGEKPKMAGFVI